MKRVIRVVLALFLLNALFGTSVFAEERKLTIGVIVPLTGSLSAIGTATKNGIELARERDPKDTSQLEVFYEDTQSKTTMALSAYRKLTKVAGVEVIFAFNSANAHALGPIAEAEKTPFVSFAFESAPARGKKFLFRPFNPSEHYVRALMQHLRATSKTEKSFHVVSTQFSFIKSMLDAFESYLLPDEKLVTVANVPPSETDFRAIITRMRGQKIDRVGVFLLPHQIVSFLKQAKEIGYIFEAYGTDFFESAVSLIENRELLKGAIYPDNDPSEEFRSMYRRRFNNEDQLTFAAAAYVMTRHLGRIMVNTNDQSGPVVADRLRRSQPVSDSMMGPFRFVSENEFGQYFRFPIVIKAIQGDHGVRIASYNIQPTG